MHVRCHTLHWYLAFIRDMAFIGIRKYAISHRLFKYTSVVLSHEHSIQMISYLPQVVA